jgi:hypothetical protein
MRGGLRSPLKPAGKELGPLRWTVTTPIAQIDHADQICAPRVKGPIFRRVPEKISPKGALRYPVPLAADQRAESNIEGLRPLRWTVTTPIAQIDHSDQICCAANQRPPVVRMLVESRRGVSFDVAYQID